MDYGLDSVGHCEIYEPHYAGNVPNLSRYEICVDVNDDA